MTPQGVVERVVLQLSLVSKQPFWPLEAGPLSSFNVRTPKTVQNRLEETNTKMTLNCGHF